jgi:uncharacterized membrane protein YphA (DoxX/SURF4 family)
MTTASEWSVARRFGFRFGLLVGVSLIYPFPVGAIPGTERLARILEQPWHWAVSWFAQRVLGLADPPLVPNGSGDRTFDYVELLLIVLLGALGAIAWSIIDRRRRAYPRLAAAASVLLRYYVATAMLRFGYEKIVRSQFPELPPGWAYQRVGDSSPMRLLWDFMGYSGPYTVFAGLAETLGGALLLWRRTATLGALVVIAVMTNVVMLNFCYDVPLKLYSTRFVVMAAVIALPGAHRLLAAAMGHAVPELAPRVRMSRPRERLRIALKLALIAAMAIHIVLLFRGTRNRSAHLHELYGNWTVESFVADGIEHPPLTTDPLRWQAWSAHSRYTAIWLMNGHRDGPAEPWWGWYPFDVDATHQTITLAIGGAHRTREIWTYTQPTPDQLVIDGVHGGKLLHVTLHREPDGLLMTRGFHWINEVPFNR